MATMSWFLVFFLSLFLIATAQPKQFGISLNSFLTPTSNPPSWRSPSGRYAFGFYPQGNGFAVGVWLAGPSNKTFVVWTANRDGPLVPADAILVLPSNGRLLLRSRGRDTPISDVGVGASSASMLDTGNFVLYDAFSEIIWQTFNSPTDTLLVGQSLLTSGELFSSASETNHSAGRFRLKMQSDGNLVIYPINTWDMPEVAIWNTATNTLGNDILLNLNNNGLSLVKSSGSSVYNLTEGLNPPNKTTAVIIYRAVLDFGGIFRLYSHQFENNGSSSMTEEWPKTFVHCDVKGFCGINSYCIQNDTGADCRCPRGFDFLDPVQKFQGCMKKFIEEGCAAKRQNKTYYIDSMKNTVWEDDPYSILFGTNEQECREACLQDCNCEAASFKDSVCRKQKLPLRYWRRSLDGSATSLIKFGNGTWASTDGFSKTSEKGLSLRIMIIIIALMGCSFVIIVVSGFLIHRRQIWRYRRTFETTEKGLTCEEFTPKPFTFSDLEKATDGFKEELGKGAFGTVYKGALSDGVRMVAVKRLDGVKEEGEKEFQREISAIGRTHHRNLVRLLGFCAEGPQRLLVYEYMSNGSLADLLFRHETLPDWKNRMRIAVDIARGILYLHEDCETPIIHCDIKPQNILMDEFHRAKISDFGLAKLMKPDQTKTFTGIRGTRGYVAPEWHKNMPVTVKADVYSFGIVLLEIICCRRNVEIEAKEEEKILCYWVYDCFQAGELEKLVTFEDVDKESLEEMVKVGLWCIQDKPSLRPSMKAVVMMFEGTANIPTPPVSSFLNSP
ncbi:hypothetical protein AAC387_Pa05g3045 [Persea americana]